MSVTLGLSLTNSGVSVHFLTADVTLAMFSAEVPNAAAVHVGAAYVQLQNVYLRLAVHAAAGLAVFVYRETADVGDNRAIIYIAQLGQLVADHLVDARIHQAHGIDHPRRAFGHAGQRVAEARVECGALYRDGAQSVKVVIRSHHVAEAEAAAGRDDGIFESEGAEAHLQVAVHSHISSSFLKTGPFLHTPAGPLVVLMAQHAQTPNPQAMRVSRLSWPEIGMTSHRARSIGLGPHA